MLSRSVVLGAVTLAALVLAIVFAPAEAIAADAEQNARFQTFLQEFRAEALDSGIRAEIYDRAMAGLEPDERVVERNNNQPEFVRTIWDYLDSVISERRIVQGREALAEKADILGHVEDTYGVPREVVTAIWGMESNYGQILGNYNLFRALATLAYDGRRQQYARRELLAALRIAQEEDIDPGIMTGSWAGAFGQMQFIPTSFLEYAVDGDGDGKRDLWNSSDDALASAASYLSRAGWRRGERWGDEVRLPAGFDYGQAESDVRRPRSSWAAAGLRAATGEALPGGESEESVLLPAGADGPAFLVTRNFGAIMRYNSAISYALAIGVLSDRLAGRGGIIGAWPQGEDTLNLRQRIALQEGLEELGYATGGADGVIGPRTREAIREFQRAHDLAADGFATANLLTRILNARQSQR